MLERPGARPHHRVRLLRRQHDHRGGEARRPSGGTPRTLCAPAGVVDQGEGGGARHRRHRTSPAVRGQRPSRRDAGLRRTHLRVPVRGSARRPCRAVHEQRLGVRGARADAEHGDRGRPGGGRTRRRSGRGGTRRRGALRFGPCRRQRGDARHRPHRRRRRGGAFAVLGRHLGGGRLPPHPVQSRVRLRRLEPDRPPVLAVPGSTSIRRRARRVRAGGERAARTLGGGRARTPRPRRMSRRRSRRRRRCRPRRGFRSGVRA